MTDKELYDVFLEVASHFALRAAAAAARSGCSIAEAVRWPCYDRVVAPTVHPWPGAGAVGAAAAAAQALQQPPRKRRGRRFGSNVPNSSAEISRHNFKASVDSFM